MSELTNLFKLILSLPMEQLALLIVGFSLVVVFCALRIVVKVLEPAKAVDWHPNRSTHLRRIGST
jgi:hypothetical protein